MRRQVCWCPLAMLGRWLARSKSLIREPARRQALGRAGQKVARELFTAEAIVPRYEALYRRICD